MSGFPLSAAPVPALPDFAGQSQMCRGVFCFQSRGSSPAGCKKKTKVGGRWRRRTESVSRAGSPGRRHGSGGDNSAQWSSLAGARRSAPWTASVPLRPPSPPPQETFLSLPEAPCCHENGFSKGPDPPPQGHRTGKTEMAREQRQKGAAKRGPGERAPRTVLPLRPPHTSHVASREPSRPTHCPRTSPSPAAPRGSQTRFCGPRVSPTVSPIPPISLHARRAGYWFHRTGVAWPGEFLGSHRAGPLRGAQGARARPGVWQSSVCPAPAAETTAGLRHR